jgi:hypothetical protein
VGTVDNWADIAVAAGIPAVVDTAAPVADTLEGVAEGTPAVAVPVAVVLRLVVVLVARSSSLLTCMVAG